MTVEFLPEAEEELIEGALWYESREQGLGWRFRDEVAEILTRIVANPRLWREREGGYHRANCLIFPYYIAYFIRDEKIIVAAVAHGHRNPEYWKSRLE